MLVSRRSFFSVAGSVALGAAAFALPACSGTRGDQSASVSAASSASAEASSATGSAASASAVSESSSAAESATAASSEAASTPSAGASNAIVVFFSRAGENYGVGYVEEGNTSILAKMIAEKTGADLFEVVPTNAYPEGYDECCDVALEEQNADARPTFEGDVDLSGYDTVYLGYPIWWGDLPMCLYTFLEAHDWAGKEIHPFCTHAGSGLSGTDSAVQSTCAGAQVAEGLSMPGETAQNSRDEAEAAVDAWLG